MKYDIEALANELEIGLDSIVGLYSSYIEEMKEEIEEMKSCLENSDWDMLQRVVHNIKGVSANLNISDVYNEAEKFDALLKKHITENSRENVNNLVELIKNAEAEIRLFFEENGYEM